jgi:2-(1,2-epoxy-1,2-dihydrophenyl)acetyl-CoA isomerase
MGNYVLYEARDGIATLTLNYPEKLNPIAIPLQTDLRDALARLAEDKSVRAAILTGAGRAFCVGADLSGMRPAPDDTRSQGNRSGDMMEQLSNKIILALRESPVPVVAAVNGPAAGAGVGIALACDIVVAARSAYFYLPFMPRLGIVPDLGTTWFLPRLVGRARATAMSLLAERLSAEQAAQWGLIWASFDDDALMDEARSVAARLAAMPAHAIAEIRNAYDAAETNGLAQQLSYEATRQRELIDKETFAEGVRAFQEKREPKFSER